MGVELGHCATAAKIWFNLFPDKLTSLINFKEREDESLENIEGKKTGMMQLNCITYNKISMKSRHNFYIKKCSVEVQYTDAGEKTFLI